MAVQPEAARPAAPGTAFQMQKLLGLLHPALLASCRGQGVSTLQATGPHPSCNVLQPQGGGEVARAGAGAHLAQVAVGDKNVRGAAQVPGVAPLVRLHQHVVCTGAPCTGQLLQAQQQAPSSSAGLQSSQTRHSCTDQPQRWAAQQQAERAPQVAVHSAVGHTYTPLIQCSICDRVQPVGIEWLPCVLENQAHCVRVPRGVAGRGGGQGFVLHFCMTSASHQSSIARCWLTSHSRTADVLLRAGQRLTCVVQPGAA